jgi:hypothetical protein
VVADGGADHAASLFLWHFTEEIEHRSSAFGICGAAVGNRLYRAIVLSKVVRHINDLMKTITDDFADAIRAADRGTVTGSLGFRSAAFRCIPRHKIAAILYRLALSQAPLHRPERQPIPDFATEWYTAETDDKDLIRWYAELHA